MKTYEKPQMEIMAVKADIVTLSLPVIDPTKGEVGKFEGNSPSWS